jgi:hypothetical protein
MFATGSKLWQEVLAARDAESDRESLSSEPASGLGEKEEPESNQILDTVMKECCEGTLPTVSILVSLPIHVVEQVLEFQVPVPVSVSYKLFVYYVTSSH